MKQTEMKQTSGWLSVMIIWKCIKQTIACVQVFLRVSKKCWLYMFTIYKIELGNFSGAVFF